MELVQTVFNYAWLAVVYMFIAWLAYFFYKESSAKTKTLTSAFTIALLAFGISTGELENQYNELVAASDKHIASLNTQKQ